MLPTTWSAVPRLLLRRSSPSNGREEVFYPVRPPLKFVASSFWGSPLRWRSLLPRVAEDGEEVFSVVSAVAFKLGGVSRVVELKEISRLSLFLLLFLSGDKLRRMFSAVAVARCWQCSLPGLPIGDRAKFFSVSFRFLPSDFFRSCSPSSSAAISGPGERASAGAANVNTSTSPSVARRGGSEAGEQQRRGRPSLSSLFRRWKVAGGGAGFVVVAAPLVRAQLLSSRRHVLLLQPLHHFRRAPGRADGQRASALGHEVPWLRSRHNSSSSSKTWAGGLERRAGAVGPIRAEEGRSSSPRRALLNTGRCNPESCG